MEGEIVATVGLCFPERRFPTAPSEKDSSSLPSHFAALVGFASHKNLGRQVKPIRTAANPIFLAAGSTYKPIQA
jgi:hypothetical protein